MEWLKPLLGHTVGLDTAPLIYFIERNPLYFQLIRPLFEAVEHGGIEVVTSTITLTEVMIHPLRQGNMTLAQEYSRILLNASHVRTLAVSPQLALEAARLRAKWGYKTPDAIQLATAQYGHAKFFVTNDGNLANVPGLQVVVLKHQLTNA